MTLPISSGQGGGTIVSQHHVNQHELTTKGENIAGISLKNAFALMAKINI